MNFTPLHVYSGYSYLKSGLKLEEYLKQAKLLGYQILSLTDYENMTGVPKFVLKAKEKGFKPLVGEDLIVEDTLLTFIVLNEEGYLNLLKLNYANQKKELTIDYIKENQNGLVVILSTNEPIIVNQLQSETLPRQLAKFARGIKHFYLGLEKNDILYMNSVRDFSYSHGYSLVAFPFVRYVKKEDAIVLKMLEAVETKEVLTEKKCVGDEFLLDEKTIENIYKNEEVELTNVIATMVNFELIQKRGKMLTYENELQLSSDEYLKQTANKCLVSLGLTNEAYQVRLNEELQVIFSMGYSDYFLIVKDYVDYARTHNIIVGPGRGSAVGCLVSYVLGITQCDPLKYGLIFERFLNKQRQTLPDIDIDFEDTRREEIANHIREKYGTERVAKIVAVQKFGAKQALGDVGRVFNYERRDIELFTKLIKKEDEKLSLRELYKTVPDFKKLVNDDKYYLEIVTLANKLEGLPRQSGLHAAGIVINADALPYVLPVSVDSDGNLIEQFEKDYLENQSFLKMDLLSLRNLTIIKDCLNRIKVSRGVILNDEKIPFDDPKAIQQIASIKTMGLFQIESFGMRKSIKALKPTEFEDIVALLALYRPGPMQNIEEYAKRKNHKSAIKYTSEVLKSILSPTYGIIVYQEQVMQIANKMAGFSFGEADLLRRAISKKDSTKLASYSKMFVDGAIKNGYKKEDAEEVYKLIYRFGDYGFNRSHALGYAVLTCRMAYLKAYYPKEFYASILSNSNSENFALTISEMKAAKIAVSNPDVNVSSYDYEIKGNSIIFPLTAVKGVMGVTANDIINEREGRPFTDFFDFVVRMNKYKLNAKQLMALIDSGALDSFDKSRASLRMNIPAALNYASMVGDSTGEMIIDMSMFPKPTLAHIDDDILENLNKEFDALGLMISGSPLQVVKDQISNITLTNIADISSSNGNINIACIFRSIKAIKTKKGKPMAFATIYDDSGEMEITIFSDAYESSFTALKKNSIVIVEGYYNHNKEELVVNQIKKLEDIQNA